MLVLLLASDDCMHTHVKIQQMLEWIVQECCAKSSTMALTQPNCIAGKIAAHPMKTCQTILTLITVESPQAAEQFCERQQVPDAESGRGQGAYAMRDVLIVNSSMASNTENRTSSSEELSL